jgi:hypothetical protein
MQQPMHFEFTQKMRGDKKETDLYSKKLQKKTKEKKIREEDRFQMVTNKEEAKALVLCGYERVMGLPVASTASNTTCD